MTETTVPAVGEVLKDSPSNWGKWGPDDEVGWLNYLGPEQVLAAAGLISSGKVFTLQRLIGDPKGDPVWPGRTPAERTQILDEGDWDEGGKGPAFPGGLHYADDKINAFLQGSTQYDGLGHVWYDGQIWNGYDARTTIGGLDKGSVEPIAQRGVVGRGVLLDMARFRGKTTLDAAETFTHEDLLACARPRASRSASATSWSSARTTSSCSTTGGEVLRGLLRAGAGLQPRARAVVRRHGDPQPGHRHDRQRGHLRPEQRRRPRPAQRPHAQPRRHAHRDRRPRGARRRLRGGRRSTSSSTPRRR